jgi:hypothetical protein
LLPKDSLLRHSEEYPYALGIREFSDIATFKLISLLYPLSKDFDLKIRDVFVVARQREATDPRDYVHGCLSLLHGATAGISPDYGKSIADIYTEAIMAMFAQDEDLRFLGSA